MINFQTEDYTFNVRASGFLLFEDRILLQRLNGEGEWSLPGGRVELGESSEAAYEREIKEETGLVFLTRKLFAVVENFFHKNEKNYHEINFYYEARIEKRLFKEHVLDLDSGSKLIFRWHKVDDVLDLETFPREVFSTYLESRDCNKIIHLCLT